MALSDVMKKREPTAEGEAKKKKESKGLGGLLENVKIVIAVIVIACILLITLIVYTNKKSEDTLKKIENVKQQIAVNTNEISRLEGFKAKINDVRREQEYYASQISVRDFDEYKLRIEVEKEIEAHNCNLTEDPVVEFSNMGSVQQASVTVKISGEFSDIMRYCNDFLSKEEITRIDAFSINGTSTNGTAKTAEITVVYFSK